MVYPKATSDSNPLNRDGLPLSTAMPGVMSRATTVEGEVRQGKGHSAAEDDQQQGERIVPPEKSVVHHQTHDQAHGSADDQGDFHESPPPRKFDFSLHLPLGPSVRRMVA